VLEHKHANGRGMLASTRSSSIRRSRFDSVTPCASAIARTWLQNGSLRLILVLWPRILTERLMMADFPPMLMGSPPNLQNRTSQV
jgi:hypothetical protein